MNPFARHLRNTFLAGIFAAIPVVITVVLVVWIEEAARGPLYRLTGINIPFAGVFVAIAVVYLLGLIVSSLVGKWLLGAVDRLLSRIPLLRELYTAWKHISLTPGGGEGGMFSKVCLIPDEDQRWLIGFTSGKPLPGDPQHCCVFVPASPNPTSGQLFVIACTKVKRLDLTPEEGFKMILSGGNYLPTPLSLDHALPDHPKLGTTDERR